MIRVTLFILLILSAFGSVAQKYNFLEFSTIEGLPQSQVQDIYQDKEGYLWVATLGGLGKFNGTEFISFGNEEGLFNNRVSLVKSINKHLFIGHEGGISIQESPHSFKSYTLPKPAEGVKITSILPYKEELLLFTNGAGIYSFKEGKIKLFSNKVKKIRAAIIYKDYIYIASKNGLYKLDKSNSLSLQSNFPVASLSGICVQKNKIYASSYNGKVYALNLKNQITDTLIDEKDPFRKVQIIDNTLWVNSKYGITKLNLETSVLIRFSTENGLPINDITKIFEDKEANIWIGTSGKGLLKFSGEAITSFSKQDGLDSDFILSVAQAKDNAYYFSTFDAGVIKMDTSGNFSKVFEKNRKIWSSCVLDNDDILFGTNTGIIHFTNNVFTTIPQLNNIVNKKVSCIIKTKNGRIIAGGNHGIATINLNQKNITSDIIIKEEFIAIRDLIEVEGKIYFIAKKKIGYIANNKVHYISSEPNANYNSIAIDKNNIIWVGSDQGLNKLVNDTLIDYEISTVANGINYINFLENFKDYLYVGTNNGLLRINVNSNASRRIGMNEGLTDLETNVNSSFIDNKHNLWFGTSNGSICFDLTREYFQKSVYKPLLNLAEVKLLNTSSSNILDTITLSNMLVLNHKQNSLSLKLDGIFLSNPSSLKYTYKLDGQDDSWSSYSDNSEITFIRLSPGNYTLLAKVKNDSGTESNEMKFSFTISSPWYATWWFYVLVGLITFTLLYLTISTLSKRREQKKNLVLQKNQLLLKSKLSNLEQQSLNASMNRHFIFNSLNSIQYYINANDKLAANKFLTRFAKLIRKNLDSSHENGGLVSLNDELERLELYLDLEKMRFTNKFNYAIKVEDTVETENIEVPAMLLQPFVENSIIHGVLPKLTNDGFITVNVTQKETFCKIEIIDNGIGIDKSKATKNNEIGDHNSKGMEITTNRINVLRQLSARVVELEGPYQLTDNNGLINGTCVTIKILK